ncbi:MAG: ABC transporter permease [Cyclobacteriaceae bacterium]
MIRPPFWPLKLLNRLCPTRLSEAIAGDLLEQFESDLEQFGKSKSRRRFIWNSLRFMHPSILFRNKIKMKAPFSPIAKSHIKVAFRSILKHRFYSSINILGLSFSIAFVFLSWLFIQNESSYDGFHENAANIYRTYTYNVVPETGEVVDGSHDGITPVPLGPALKEEVPSVTHASRFGSSTGTVILNNTPYEELICMVDQDFLEMFSFSVTNGSTFNILNNQNAILLSSEKAKKYFGTNEPLGQELEITLSDSTRTFVVAGIVENHDNKSSIKFDILVPFQTMGMAASETHMTSYNVSFVENWIMLDRPARSNISEVLTSIINTRTGNDDGDWIVDVQPLSQVHFDTKITGYASYTNPQKLWSMGALVILVLVIAIINFIALTTGHSFNRVKEMGLRKTLGTFKSALRFQLIAESFVFTLISGLLGVVIAWFMLPAFNQLIEATIPGAFSATNIGFIVVLTLIPGIICGLSQSALLVKIKPIEALKGTNILSSKESWFNQGLIVLQFSISILLIIGTIAIRSQMNYIQQRDLGFDEERLIEISTQSPENLQEAQLLFQRFKAEVLQNPSISEVSASMNSFQEPWTQFAFAQTDGEDEKLYFNLVDRNYVEAMQIELVQGEKFSSGDGAATSILVNEELVRHFEWDNPLDQQLPGRNFDTPHKIIGVVKDFHFSSLHNEIEPVILAINPGTVTSGATGLSTYVWPPNLYQLVVRIGPGDIRESMAFLESTWKEVNGAKPFTFKFIDDSLAESYAEETKWQQLIDVASAFAIIIAWMGLLGLMRISVQKRLKEIGIRKVLGSSVFGVTFSLSKRFLILVGIANLIAWPVAWLGVSQWLESFSYRIDMSILILLAGGLAVALVAVFSVGFQARRAASVNPVECLRNE